MFSFAIRDTTHCGCLLPPPLVISTPATTGVNSALTATTPWRFSNIKFLATMRVAPAPSLSHEADSPRRASMSAFPVSQKASLCHWRVVTACCYVLGPGHVVEHPTLTTLIRRGIPFRRLSCLVYFCLVCCLPPESCRPQQDTPILALPLRRRRRCTRIAYGCVQDILTINEERFYCLPTTTSNYFIWRQHTFFCCATNRVEEKRASK